MEVVIQSHQAHAGQQRSADVEIDLLRGETILSVLDHFHSDFGQI